MTVEYLPLLLLSLLFLTVYFLFLISRCATYLLHVACLGWMAGLTNADI